MIVARVACTLLGRKYRFLKRENLKKILKRSELLQSISWFLIHKQLQNLVFEHAKAPGLNDRK